MLPFQFFKAMLSLSLLLAFGIQNTFSQTQKTENIVLITLDGMRWQEVFNGADSLLLGEAGQESEFWHSSPLERRRKLMPFTWSVLENQGQLYGNRTIGNLVNTSNTMWFSYPGYNEILTGKADDERINSNNKVNNPNITFLEHLNKIPDFQGKIRAFGSWDVFPYIINEERSDIPVNAGWEKVTGSKLTEREKILNRLKDEIQVNIGPTRLDAFTYHLALEALRNQKPKVLYIAFDETDHFAHGGKYGEYLLSANQIDRYIQEIWETLQSDPRYKEKTTLLVTTDHGRGTTTETWKGHGDEYAEAGQVWMMAIGPDTPADGEMKVEGQWNSSMIARTIFKLLGLEYPDPDAGQAIQEMVK
ncbi:hypothetical protein GCM10009119_26460 [Algoriphagus jejuensis]|uniref:Type I phosphodiesterase/nucleotide pyrophosphatase n=2 Tax=Algoriphagus jejuensis TaxID=419934 RepID=A0ABP3YHZ5_9BACT